MLNRLTTLAAATAALAMAAFSANGRAAEGTTVTFTKDVAPIFYKNCVECHRPTMFAPMSLMSYDDTRPWAKSIKQRVVSRTMPPWGADPSHGVFRNDPTLSEKEIATISSWVDAGAPKGDDKDLPVAPKFVDGWTIGKPDAVFQMETAFEIPANGTVDYKYMRVPMNLPEDKWIQAIEIVPEARSHVHHVIAFTQPSGEPIKEGAVLGPTNIGGVTPNKPGLVFPDGVARHLTGRSDMILQVHYTTNGTAASDRTKVGIIYAKNPPKKQAAGGLALNPTFKIPAGEGNHEVRATQLIQRDTVVTALTPHMHVRGKDMTYIAHYPDGKDEVLLSVPKYDFNWQITYMLAEAKTLPKGTKVEVIAHFDNSTGNKFNPDPTKDVKWGDQTWEEMMIGFWSTVVDIPVTSLPQDR